MQMVILAFTTLVVAAFASLVGVGGGFLLMPIFLVMYPFHSHEALTFISLFAVLVNAVSATLNNTRMNRIDYKTGLILAAFTLPTATVARFALQGLDRSQFGRLLGFILIAIGMFILRRMLVRTHTEHLKPFAPRPGWAQRKITDSTGRVYEYSFPMPLAAGSAAIGGFIASFFGIGGGALVMPVLTQILRFPAHVAASTSILVLSASAFAGVTTDVVRHLGHGSIGEIPIWLALAAGIGAFAGAQIGTRLSRHVSGKRILILLGIAVIAAGARLLFMPRSPVPSAPTPPPTRDSMPLTHVKAIDIQVSAKEILPCCAT